jgi:hypothetical protein
MAGEAFAVVEDFHGGGGEAHSNSRSVEKFFLINIL